MSYYRDSKDRYESALACRFLRQTYGSDSEAFVLVERPEFPPRCGGRRPRSEGWPDFVYQAWQRCPRLVLEIGRLIEGDAELRFERSVEAFGKKVSERVRGRLPGFYLLEIPYDLKLPRGRGKVRACERLLDELVNTILDAACRNANCINISQPVQCKLIKLDRPESDVFVTPMKYDVLDDDTVLGDPIYFNRFKDLLVESNHKFTGFEGCHNVLVLDVTDSKMHLDLLAVLAQREWDLHDLVPALAPRLKEVHLCEGPRVWSGAGGRQLRHKYREDVPSSWVRLWLARRANSLSLTEP